MEDYRVTSPIGTISDLEIVKDRTKGGARKGARAEMYRCLM